jgi:hypothetical protein
VGVLGALPDPARDIEAAHDRQPEVDERDPSERAMD